MSESINVPKLYGGNSGIAFDEYVASSPRRTSVAEVMSAAMRRQPSFSVINNTTSSSTTSSPRGSATVSSQAASYDLSIKELRRFQIAKICREFQFSFEAIIDCEETRSGLEEFLYQIHCQEQYLFLGAVDSFARLRLGKNRFKVATDIVKNFIQQGSIYELNISDDVRQQLLRKMETVSAEQCPKDMFEKVAFVVFEQLQLEAHFRYTSSKEFQQSFSLLVSRTCLGQALEILDARPITRRLSAQADQQQESPRSDTSSAEESNSEKTPRSADSIGYDSLVFESQDAALSPTAASPTDAQAESSVSPTGDQSPGNFASRPSWLRRSSKVFSHSVDEQQRRKLLEQYCSQPEMCIAPVLGMHHLYKTNVLLDARYESVFWETAFREDNILGRVSKKFFCVGGSKTCVGWSTSHKLPCRPEQLLNILLSDKDRITADGSLVDSAFLRTMDKVDDVSAKIRGLACRQGAAQKEFDSAVEFSGAVSLEMIKMAWPLKNRCGVFLTAGMKSPDSDKITILRTTFRDPSFLAKKGVVEFSAVTAQTIEPAGTDACVLSEWASCNFAAFVPISAIKQGILRRICDSHASILKIIGEKKERGELDSAPEGKWGMAVLDSIQKNSQLLTLLQAAKHAALENDSK